MRLLDLALLPTHPTSGLRAIGVIAGRPVWPVMGAADGDDDGSGGGSGSDDDGAGSGGTGTGDDSKGFPPNTPVAEMTTEQQVAYWKHQSRKHEATAKSRGDYDQLKTKAAEADRLRQERETESEKAVREASEKAAGEERAKQAPRLVSAEFRAAAKGVLTTEQTTALLEDLDLTKYLDDKGEVDIAKVERKVAAFAPPKEDPKRRRLPDTGGGNRGGTVSTKGAAGAAEAERRFAKSGKQ